MLKQHVYSLPKSLGLLATCLAVLFSFFFSQQASASTTSETPYLADVYVDKVYKDLSAHQHYYWLYSCFKNVDIDKVTKGEVDSWDFFEDDDMNAALGTMYDTYKKDAVPGRRDCKNQSIVKSAFNYLGYTNSRETFCKISGATYNGKAGDENNCIAGAGGHDWDNNKSKDAVASWLENNAKKNKPALAGPHYYMRAYSSLVNGCDVRFPNTTLYDTSNVPGSQDGDKFAVPIIVKEGEVYVKKFILGVGVDGDTKRIVVANTREASQISDRVTEKTCNALATEARDNVDAYLSVLKRTDTAIDPQDSRNETGTVAEETTCAVEGIGWIVCPVVNFLGQITDEMYDILDNNLLEVPAGQIFDTNGYAYQAWSTMRNIANVAFVIAFLFIIYAQITGMGITNYGVKKLLPKIVIAAILVNTSFWLCAIAVDVSNIAGYSTKNMFDSAMAANSSFAIEGVGTLETGSWWTQLGVGILAASGLVYVGLSVLLPALVVVSFAVITVVAVLAVRQALVILLIVISPLAFVAYLLPNTESWFKKWLGLFRTMLLVFPIISAVFGASALASIIIMGVAEEEGSIIIGVVGALISIVPLFITPILMRSAGGVLNRVGGFINNPNKGPFDRARKSAEGYRSKRKDINKADRLNGTSTFGRRAAKWKDSNNRFTRGAGSVLGASSTPGELVAGGLAGRKLTKDKQAASAKAAAEFAEQNYVATRAANENSGYAQKIAGPTGSASLAQAYAIEAMQKEAMKDRAAEKTIFEHNGTSFQDLGKGIREGAFSGAREEAALQRYFETANSDGVQGMLEHINTMRSNPGLEGQALTRAKELTQVAGEALANSPLKPKNLSASNLNKLRNGEAIQAEAARITSTVAEGKINASSIGQMDIDEIRRWTSNMVENSSLLATADPGKIEATRQAIIEAENDARINVKFGDREREGLTQLKDQLTAQLAVASSPVGQKARQDAAAATYGPNI